MIAATWCTSANIGDRLTSWLLERITGEEVVYVDHRDLIPKLMVTGSVLGWADAMTTVWGAGILESSDVISPLAVIHAVRGPRSLERVVECGAKPPKTIGDPALLCPDLYEPAVAKRPGTIGFVPHYTDQHYLLHEDLPEKWLFLNVFDEVERFIDNMCSCELVVSSSLHGLVLADAYGIPSVRTVVGDRLGGSGIKFEDYLLSVKRHPGMAIVWREVREMTTRELRRCADLGKIDSPVSGLWASLPVEGGT